MVHHGQCRLTIPALHALIDGHDPGLRGQIFFRGLFREN